MAYLDLNGVRLHYTDTGAGDVAVVFSHGLLFSTEMLTDQIAHLKAKYRCIAYDHRGQGQSGAPEGEYDMDTLASDAAGLITALGVEKAISLVCRWVDLWRCGWRWITLIWCALSACWTAVLTLSHRKTKANTSF